MAPRCVSSEVYLNNQKAFHYWFLLTPPAPLPLPPPAVWLSSDWHLPQRGEYYPMKTEPVTCDFVNSLQEVGRQLLLLWSQKYAMKQPNEYVRREPH